MRVSTILFALSFVLATPILHAQKSNEIAFELGGTFTPSRPVVNGPALSFSPAFTLGLEYDHRILRVPGGSLAAGIDFAASPFDVITNAGPSTAINQYAYIFATPHLRYTLHPIRHIEPWGSVGVGYADYNEGSYRSGAANVYHGTKGPVGEFSLGADYTTPLRIVFPVILRLNVRDYLAAPPSYNAAVPPSQNNVVVSFGFVLAF